VRSEPAPTCGEPDGARCRAGSPAVNSDGDPGPAPPSLKDSRAGVGGHLSGQHSLVLTSQGLVRSRRRAGRALSTRPYAADAIRLAAASRLLAQRLWCRGFDVVTSVLRLGPAPVGFFLPRSVTDGQPNRAGPLVDWSLGRTKALAAPKGGACQAPFSVSIPPQLSPTVRTGEMEGDSNVTTARP
jgi:hypothetical protein